MSFENHMTLKFPGRPENEAFARSAVACFASQLGPTLEELGDIRTAVSEAVTNCIAHAYPDNIGIIALHCHILKGKSLDIVIRDKGIGIIEPNLGGMGFTIMESLMTTFSAISEPSKGTTVHMCKRIYGIDYNSDHPKSEGIKPSQATDANIWR